MSKKDDLGNAIKGITSGFIAPQIAEVKDSKKDVSEDTPKTQTKSKQRAKQEKLSNITASNDVSKVIYKNGENLNDNYTITFKIHADIEDYLRNIEKIAFIESVKSGKIDSTTRTEFVNDLIREQFYKLIDASDDDTADDINNKWLSYKNNNNL